MLQTSEVKTANVRIARPPNYKKSFVNNKFLILALILVLCVGAIGSFLMFQFANNSSAKAKNVLSKEKILSLINLQRKNKNIKALKSVGLLNLAAQKKAADMAANSYFSHYRPLDKKRGLSFIQDAGYRYISAGENLAIYYDKESEMVADWMNSPTHRANILNRSFNETGIGIASGKYQGYQTYFVVQFFASGDLGSNFKTSNPPSSNKLKRSTDSSKSQSSKPANSINRSSSSSFSSQNLSQQSSPAVGIDLSTAASGSSSQPESLEIDQQKLQETINNVSDVFENQFDELEEN